MDATLKSDILEEKNVEIEVEEGQEKIEIDETLETVKDNPNEIIENIEETVEVEIE